MPRYQVNEVVGNMRIVKQKVGKMTTKGLIPYYDCECQECGRVREMSHDALRKRKNTGAIKCMSCCQEKLKEEKSKSTHSATTWELKVPVDLYRKFVCEKR